MILIKKMPDVANAATCSMWHAACKIPSSSQDEKRTQVQLKPN